MHAIKKPDQVLKKRTKTGPYLRGITDQNRTNLVSIPDFMRQILDLILILKLILILILY